MEHYALIDWMRQLQMGLLKVPVSKGCPAKVLEDRKLAMDVDRTSRVSGCFSVRHSAS